MVEGEREREREREREKGREGLMYIVCDSLAGNTRAREHSV